VATNGGGIARLIDDQNLAAARRKFVSYQLGESADSNRVNALLFDSQNNPWCATDGGLYRGAFGQHGELKFDCIATRKTEIKMTAFADREGRLWFGMQKELIEVIDDKAIKYGPDDAVGRHDVVCIVENNRGGLFAANWREVFEFTPPAKDEGRGRWQKLPLTLKPDQDVNAMLSDSAGALWIGTANGLVKYQDGKQTLYTSARGLSDDHIASLTQDRDGNLWIGTVGGGVCKLESEQIASFTRSEGLPNRDVQKVIEDRQGNIFASIENGGVVTIVEGRAVPLSETQAPPFANFNERIIQDRRGDWWVGTNAGLYRFQGPQLQFRRGQKFTSRNGLGDAPMGGLYEDRDGKIWVSPEDQGLYCFDPAQSAQVVFKQVIPPSTITHFSGPQRTISDRAGTLWLGAHEWLGRLMNGQVAMLPPTEGLPETRPRALFVDSRGWLWIGLRYRGVSVTRDPASANPHFFNYSTANGLASDAVWAIAEDDSGRMYFGTGKGLDQLDLATGRIRAFNSDDGLAGDVVNNLLKDRQGHIWVATTLGLSKFNPRAEPNATAAAPIYLSHIQIAGENLLMPETGALHLPGIELPASRNNLTIEFVALSFHGENELRYQYKLDGVDKDWSAPTESRSINYARLAPGSYQFLVRAVNQDGTITPTAASFQFRILPPLWQRWWFIALAALATGLIMYRLYRQRLARLIELERIRTRIATDLHDDIGANLSLIAMLSEVSRGQLRESDSRLKEWLTTIAATSRDTVDSMSDIVWAVNPKRDHLRDLTRKMRRFADDILGARNIALRFREPDTGLDLRLSADLRREVFLIFKETINNLVRHSQCTEASVDLRIDHGRLVLHVSDNGRGLHSANADAGTGLASMRDRAERLGGSFEISSSNEAGTIVTLNISLDHRPRL
jgi:ligand-binding sensor domain-containing protein/signal transduction histidine kinase